MSKIVARLMSIGSELLKIPLNKLEQRFLRGLQGAGKVEFFREEVFHA
jgi:hypothetical protein